MKTAQVQATNNHEVLPCFMEDSVILLCQMFAALVYVETLNSELCTMPYRVLWTLGTEESW